MTTVFLTLVAAPAFAQSTDPNGATVVATTAPPVTLPPTTTPPVTTAAPTTVVATTAAPTTAPPTVVTTSVAPTTVVTPPTQPPQSAPVVTTKPIVAPTVPKVTVPKVAPPKVDGSRPKAVPAGSTSIEVDIRSQRLLLFKNGSLFRSIHVSTGSGRHYCDKGSCATANTPRGRFRIYNRISGWRTSHLGRLFNPLYFNGGFAIHGAGSVPNYPASHGCIRVAIATANWLPSVVANGTPVWVH